MALGGHRRIRFAWDGENATAAMKKAAGDGLKEVADHLLQASRDDVPVESGQLWRSGQATVDRARLIAAVSYDTEYAVAVHEDLDDEHPSGGGPKYLESTMHRERAEMLEILADRIRAAQENGP